MNNSFIHFNNYPPIYKISLDNRQELLAIYSAILKDVPVDDVAEKFASHISSTIEPTDWRGIWRTGITVTPGNGSVFGSSSALLDRTLMDRSSVLSDRSDSRSSSRLSKEKTITIKCDFEVEVVDVSQSNLTAVVLVRNLLSPTLDSLTTSSFDAINDFLNTKKVRTVKLSEMYVISEGDEDEHLLPTAMVIEQVRFFYKYIWRPWDDLVHSDLLPCKNIFIENKNRLENRLNLYFDVKNKLISESTINKIHYLISEGKKYRSQLDLILSKNANDKMDLDSGQSSSSTDMDQESNLIDMALEDQFMDETDVYEMMKIKVKLEDIEREMKLLEDPYLRVVATSINRPLSDMDHEEEDDDEADDGNIDSTITDTVDSTIRKRSEENKIHVLCKRVTSKELTMVNERINKVVNGQSINADIEILFYKKLNRIMSSPSLKDGDRILILPGVHIVESLPWIDRDITVEGLSSDPKDAVLVASDLIGDIFVNCASNAISLSNITIKTSSDTHAIVMVHNGSTDLINCVIEGPKGSSDSVTSYSIVSLSKADVVIDNCSIFTDLSNNGILRKPGSHLTIDGKEVAVTADEPIPRTGCERSSKSSLKSVQFDEKILNTAN